MTNAVRKSIPTSAQIVKEQKERADREREARLAAGRKAVVPQPAAKQPQDKIERLTGQVVAPAKATSVAVPDTRTPQQAYLDEIAPPSSLVGRPIKFDGKAGKWLFGDTDEEISPDTDFIPLCDEILIGWIKFNGKGEQPDRIQGLLYDGFVMPPLSSLPDRDQSKWELGLDGEPADPWQHQMCLILQSPGTHELGTFATSSRTGRRASATCCGTTIACARKTTIITPSSGSRSQATTIATSGSAGCTRRSLPSSARPPRHPPPSPTRHLVATSTTPSRSEERSREMDMHAPADSRESESRDSSPRGDREKMRAGHRALRPR